MTTSGGVLATPFARLRGDIYVNDDLPDPPDVDEDETASPVAAVGGTGLALAVCTRDGNGQHVVTPVAQVVAATDETDEERDRQ